CYGLAIGAAVMPCASRARRRSASCSSPFTRSAWRGSSRRSSRRVMRRSHSRSPSAWSWDSRFGATSFSWGGRLEKALLELEVALDRRDRETLRGHVDRVHPVAAEHGERAAARVEHLRGNDPLVELARRSGFAGRSFGELRVLKDAAQNEVVPGELGERRDETARSFLVDEIGEQDRERAARGLRAKEFECRAVVGLGRGHLEATETFSEAKKLPMSAAWRVVRADRVRESEETHLIALRDSDVAQHQRGVHSVVELRQPAERARHHPSGVEQDEHALLPLGLVLDTDRPAAPRRRRPGDPPRIVVRLVLAQSFEERPRAGDTRAALTGVVGEPAPEAHFVAADLL